MKVDYHMTREILKRNIVFLSFNSRMHITGLRGPVPYCISVQKLLGVYCKVKFNICTSINETKI